MTKKAKSRYDIYRSKWAAYFELSEIKTEHKLTAEDFRDVADHTDLTVSQVKYLWRVAKETGAEYVDRRVKSGNYFGAPQFNILPATKVNNKTRQVDSITAGKVIKEYMMNSNITIFQLCMKHNITVNQFYNWVKEITNCGTLLGRRILNTNHNAKFYIVDVIWRYKKPNTKRDSIISLSAAKGTAYNTIAEELIRNL